MNIRFPCEYHLPLALDRLHESLQTDDERHKGQTIDSDKLNQSGVSWQCS
jgi:hypothetical protein